MRATKTCGDETAIEVEDRARPKRDHIKAELKRLIGLATSLSSEIIVQSGNSLLSEVEKLFPPTKRSGQAQKGFSALATDVIKSALQGASSTTGYAGGSANAPADFAIISHQGLHLFEANTTTSTADEVLVVVWKILAYCRREASTKAKLRVAQVKEGTPATQGTKASTGAKSGDALPGAAETELVDNDKAKVRKMSVSKAARAAARTSVRESTRGAARGGGSGACSAAASGATAVRRGAAAKAMTARAAGNREEGATSSPPMRPGEKSKRPRPTGLRSRGRGSPGGVRKPKMIGGRGCRASVDDSGLGGGSAGAGTSSNPAGQALEADIFDGQASTPSSAKGCPAHPASGSPRVNDAAAPGGAPFDHTPSSPPSAGRFSSVANNNLVPLKLNQAVEYRWPNNGKWYRCKVAAITEADGVKGQLVDLLDLPPKHSKTRRATSYTENLEVAKLLADGDLAKPGDHLDWD